MKDLSFSKAELIGRHKFNNFLEKRGKTKKVEFTEDKYNKVDCITFNGITSATTEIKNRLDYSSNDKLIKDEGVVIEKTKYNYLLDTVKYSGMSDCYYSMIFNDDVMYLFNIKKISENNTPIWRLKSLPKTTCGNNTFILKEYATLPLEWGLKFQL